MRITSEVPPCIPTCFSLASHSFVSLSPPTRCKSTSSLFALRRSILLLRPALRRSSFPLLSLFSPRSFLTLRTRTCTYTQCSLRHRDHSSRFHPLGRLPFNPLLLPLASPRFHRVSAPSTTYSPPRAFLLAVSFRLPTIPLPLFPSLPFPDTRHLHPSYLYASHLRFTRMSVPPSSFLPLTASNPTPEFVSSSLPAASARGKVATHLSRDFVRETKCGIDQVETVNRGRGEELSEVG